MKTVRQIHVQWSVKLCRSFQRLCNGELGALEHVTYLYFGGNEPRVYFGANMYGFVLVTGEGRTTYIGRRSVYDHLSFGVRDDVVEDGDPRVHVQDLLLVPRVVVAPVPDQAHSVLSQRLNKQWEEI